MKKQYLAPYVLSIIFGIANISFLIMLLSKGPITVLGVSFFLPSIGRIFSEAYAYIFVDVFFILSLILFFKSINDVDKLREKTLTVYHLIGRELRIIDIVYAILVVIMYFTKSSLILAFLIQIEEMTGKKYRFNQYQKSQY